MSEAARRGTLVSGIGSFYTVLEPDGTRYTVRAKKKFRHQGMTPMVGDEVLFLPGAGGENGWLEEILPRSSVCVRPPVANITLLMLVVCPEPAPDLLLMDRLMVQARRQGIRVCLVASKSDLDPSLAPTLRQEYRGSDTLVTGVSSVTGEGLDSLLSLMHGETCCFAGQSGAGKSTLINRLFGLNLETGEISEKIRRGKNTTRRVELFVSGDIRFLDTAGFSLLEIQEIMDPSEVRMAYPEFMPYEGTCRFQPCLHDREPGCRVRMAAESGEEDVSMKRLERYREILQEVRTAWRERYD